MTCKFGGSVTGLVLWPLGGFCLIGPNTGGPLEDLWIAVAGPLTHILQGCFWLILFAIVERGDFSSFSEAISLESLREGGAGEFMSILSVQATVINAALFIFNLAIPAYPLDGGRCLAALLVMAGFKAETTGKITALTAMVIGFIMLFVGVFVYIGEGSGGGLFLAIIATFVISSGTKLLKMVNAGDVHDHPLFERECYREAPLRPLRESSGEVNNTTNIAPAGNEVV